MVFSICFDLEVPEISCCYFWSGWCLYWNKYRLASLDSSTRHCVQLGLARKCSEAQNSCWAIKLEKTLRIFTHLDLAWKLIRDSSWDASICLRETVWKYCAHFALVSTCRKNKQTCSYALLVFWSSMWTLKFIIISELERGKLLQSTILIGPTVLHDVMNVPNISIH